MLSGEIDIGVSEQLREVLGAALRGRAHAVIDLSVVGFMDSTGLRCLLGARRLSQEEDSELTLRSPSVAMRRVFDVSEIADIFEVEQDGE